MSTISPLVHALAGSIGSALSLWLMYPLERARIEMQTGVDRNEDEDNDNDSFQDALMTETNEQKSSDNHKVSKSFSGSDDSSSFHVIDPRNSNDSDGYSSSSTDISSDDGDEDIFSKKTDAISFVSCTAKSLSSGNPTVTENESRLKPPSTHQPDGNHSKSPRSSMPKSNLTVWKCLIQLHRKKQLYNGAIPMVTTLAVSNFVFFYTLHYMKRVFLRTNAKIDLRKSSSSQQLLLASSMAGIINVLCTNPLWVANLRIIKDRTKRTNLVRMILNIYHESGLRSLWSGTYASLLLVSNPVIQYFVYELGKKYLINHYIRTNKHQLTSTPRQLLLKPSLDPVNAFLLGASSKAVATVTTYPLQLAQVLLRSSKRKIRDKGTWQCLNNLYKEEGLSSLYVGMNAKLLQTVLTSAFTFLTYEQILNIVATVMRTSIS